MSELEIYQEAFDALQCPSQIREHISTFLREAHRIAGDDFVGIAVYGSAATGGYEENRSDVNLAFFAERFSLELLEALRPAHRAARRDMDLALLLLTPEEIENAVDAFPLKLSTIARNHLLLAGRDLFSEFEVDRRDFLHALEQRARTLLMRTRLGFLTHGERKHTLEGALSHAAITSRHVIEEALYVLNGAAPPKQSADLADAAKDALELSRDGLLRLWSMHSQNADDRESAEHALNMLRDICQVVDRLNQR